MSQQKLFLLIEKDETIISCKKRAKQLQQSFKNSKNKKSYMQCQTLAAIELNFKDWFELQSTIKKKYELILQLNYDYILLEFHNLLKHCLINETSHIHMQVRKNDGQIKIRKYGQLDIYQNDKKMTEDYLNNLCHIVYNEIANNSKISFNDAFEPKNYSYLHCEYPILNDNNQLVTLNLRYQSIPAYPEGYDIVITINNLQITKKSLTQLGLEYSQINLFNNALKKTNGLILIAGVTGSGKTFTLKSILEQEIEKSQNNKRLYSIEDPIEYKIENVTQINIPALPNLDKNYYEQSILDCINNNADIIMINDIRDKLTAKAIYKASTDTFIISNTHSSSALNALNRMKDFGLTNEELSNPNFLQILAYQKLLPTICHHCSYSINDLHDPKKSKFIKNLIQYQQFFHDLQEVYPNTDVRHVKLKNTNMCQHCSYGINGRIACAEVIALDKTMYQLIKEDKKSELKSYWRNFSNKNLASNDMTGKRTIEHALLHMLRGLIDPLDIENNFLPIIDMKNSW